MTSLTTTIGHPPPAFAGNAAPTSDELSLLGAHLALCRRGGRRRIALLCAAEAAHGFVAPRLITTLAAAGALIGVAMLLG